jgi:glucose-1-phosphate adenylyltransferase
MKKDIVALLLAGGVGSRLNILARHRAKPAIVFGGVFRIIDFTLSNIANCGIETVGVLTQYKPLSLMEHIDHGRPWDLFGRTRLVEVLPPKTGEASSDWYKGTSDAVFQNISFIDDYEPDIVLVVSGDHIYHMDYRTVITQHYATNADVTICLVQVPHEQAHQFGLATMGRKNRINGWAEKPSRPQSNLASMGVYVFNTMILKKALRSAAQRRGTDFARDVLPGLIRRKRVFGFIFADYWRDVGTLESYWQTNMDILDPRSGLALRSWNIKTNNHEKGEIGDRPSAQVGPEATITNSLVSRGCVVHGKIEHSVISPGVTIARNAYIKDSIIFQNVSIARNCSIEKCIIDKNVRIDRAAHIGVGSPARNRRFPRHMTNGLTIIGKGAFINKDRTIGKHCIITPGVTVDKNCRSGTTL